MRVNNRNSARTPLVRLVDDDARVRESEAFVLSIDGWKTAPYESAVDFLAEDDPDRPGCIVLDVRMPEMSGLELQTELKRQGRNLPILFLTGHGDIDMAVMALKRGAADFVQKPITPEALQQKVKKLVAWHVRFLRTLEERDAVREELAALTPRELEVARLAAKGLVTREIADMLGSSEQTVKQQRSGALQKLGVRNAVELAEILAIADEVPDMRFPLEEGAEASL